MCSLINDTSFCDKQMNGLLEHGVPSCESAASIFCVLIQLFVMTFISSNRNVQTQVWLWVARKPLPLNALFFCLCRQSFNASTDKIFQFIYLLLLLYFYIIFCSKWRSSTSISEKKKKKKKTAMPQSARNIFQHFYTHFQLSFRRSYYQERLSRGSST